MHHTIHVTSDDITHAIQQDRGHCPVARALSHALPDSRHPVVTRTEIRFSDVVKRLRYTWRTPRSAQKFVDDWDAFGPGRVRPFVFRLDDAHVIQIRPMRDRSPAIVGRGVTDPTPKDPSKIGARNRRSIVCDPPQ